jgi:hypothetical protein
MAMSCTMPPYMPSLFSAPSFHFNRVQQHLLVTLIITMPSPGTREAAIGQQCTRPVHLVLPGVRAHRALDGPERQQAPSPPSSPTPLPLHRASPPLQLARRHARMHAEALSPSSLSKDRRQYRRRTGIIPSRPLLLSLRQLARKHRHDAGKPTPSSPCLFAHQRRRTMIDLHGHPQHPSAAINRALLLLISPHHLTLLSSLLLLDHLPSHIIAGATPI